MKVGDLVKFRWDDYEDFRPTEVGFVITVKEDHVIILWADYWDKTFEEIKYLEVVSAS